MYTIGNSAGSGTSNLDIEPDHTQIIISIYVHRLIHIGGVVSTSVLATHSLPLHSVYGTQNIPVTGWCLWWEGHNTHHFQQLLHLNQVPANLVDSTR